MAKDFFSRVINPSQHDIQQFDLDPKFDLDEGNAIVVKL